MYIHWNDELERTLIASTKLGGLPSLPAEFADLCKRYHIDASGMWILGFVGWRVEAGDLDLLVDTSESMAKRADFIRSYARGLETYITIRSELNILSKEGDHLKEKKAEEYWLNMYGKFAKHIVLGQCALLSVAAGKRVSRRSALPELEIQGSEYENQSVGDLLIGGVGKLKVAGQEWEEAEHHPAGHRRPSMYCCAISLMANFGCYEELELMLKKGALNHLDFIEAISGLSEYWGVEGLNDLLSHSNIFNCWLVSMLKDKRMAMSWGFVVGIISKLSWQKRSGLIYGGLMHVYSDQEYLKRWIELKAIADHQEKEGFGPFAAWSLKEFLEIEVAVKDKFALSSLVLNQKDNEGRNKLTVGSLLSRGVQLLNSGILSNRKSLSAATKQNVMPKGVGISSVSQVFEDQSGERLGSDEKLPSNLPASGVSSSANEIDVNNEGSNRIVEDVEGDGSEGSKSGGNSAGVRRL